MVYIDQQADECGHSRVVNGTLARCNSKRAAYSVGNRQATIKCLDCKGVHRRDVTIGMQRTAWTVEGLRNWWRLA